MNRKSLIFLAVAAAIATPVAAQAPGTSSAPDSMKPADSMPKSETSAAAPAGFAALDKNGDGYLSRDEALDAPWSTRFAEIDKNNDGRISRSEHDAVQGGAARGATGKKPVK